jgi:hypothetical protein
MSDDTVAAVARTPGCTCDAVLLWQHLRACEGFADGWTFATITRSDSAGTVSALVEALETIRRADAKAMPGRARFIDRVLRAALQADTPDGPEEPYVYGFDEEGDG